MQYLLTYAEYNALESAAEKGRKGPTKRELQEFCTRVANEMPVRWTWGEGKDTPKPWGCILTVKREWYCDECPARRLCPHDNKNWSK